MLHSATFLDLMIYCIAISDNMLYFDQLGELITFSLPLARLLHKQKHA